MIAPLQAVHWQDAPLSDCPAAADGKYRQIDRSKAARAEPLNGGLRFRFATMGCRREMGSKQQHAEWLASADLCRTMAERSHEPLLRTRWLTLAQQWLALCAPAPQTDSERFDTAVQDKDTGQQRSHSSN